MAVFKEPFFFSLVPYLTISNFPDHGGNGYADAGLGYYSPSLVGQGIQCGGLKSICRSTLAFQLKGYSKGPQESSMIEIESKLITNDFGLWLHFWCSSSQLRVALRTNNSSSWTGPLSIQRFSEYPKYQILCVGGMISAN